MQFTVNYANSKDEALAAAQVLQDVSQWLENTQQGLWKPQQFSSDWALRHLEKHELVILKVGDKVAATMLLLLEDADFWEDYPSSKAVFVHKLAVARAFAGQGLARALLEFAALEARRLGRAWVRLDSAKRQVHWCLYTSAGFEHLDSKRVFDVDVWRFQRPVV